MVISLGGPVSCQSPSSPRQICKCWWSRSYMTSLHCMVKLVSRLLGVRVYHSDGESFCLLQHRATVLWHLQLAGLHPTASCTQLGKMDVISWHVIHNLSWSTSNFECKKMAVFRSRPNRWTRAFPFFFSFIFHSQLSKRSSYDRQWETLGHGGHRRISSPKNQQLPSCEAADVEKPRPKKEAFAAITLYYYRKRGSASYIVREVHSVRERDTER